MTQTAFFTHLVVFGILIAAVLLTYAILATIHIVKYFREKALYAVYLVEQKQYDKAEKEYYEKRESLSPDEFHKLGITYPESPRWVRKPDFELGDFIFGTVIAVVLAAVLALAFMPFDGKYHHFYEVKGELTSLQQILELDDETVTAGYLAEVEGHDGLQIETWDSRLLNYVGEEVDLTCTISWSPHSADHLYCSLDGSE